jgi:hypothetical protein
MKSAQNVGSAALRGTAALLLTTAFAMSSAAAQTSAKSSTHKATPTAAARRAPSRNSKLAAASSHTSRRGSTTVSKASGGVARVSNRRVIVTRKKIHGRWVRTTSVVHVAARPSYQTHPDPDRYREIQEALAANGYFKGDANGAWGDDSVDALKRFQADHQLPNDGKISSLSLIGLGLGPSHATAAVPPGKDSAAASLAPVTTPPPADPDTHN